MLFFQKKCLFELALNEGHKKKVIKRCRIRIERIRVQFILWQCITHQMESRLGAAIKIVTIFRSTPWQCYILRFSIVVHPLSG